MFVDVRMLVDTVTIQKPTGETDRFDKAVLSEPLTLKRVRFDKAQHKTGTGNDKERQNESVLYVYPRYSINAPVIDKSWLDGVVTHQGEQYIIKKIETYPQAFSSKTFAYEIEVI